MRKQRRTKTTGSQVVHRREREKKVLKGLGEIDPAARALIHVEPGPKPQRMILLPGRTLKAREMGKASSGVFLLSLAAENPKPPVSMKIIDSVHENGAKLVEMTSEAAQKLLVA